MTQLYMYALKFEVHIISICHRLVVVFFNLFQSLKNAKAGFCTRAVADQFWPLGGVKTPLSGILATSPGKQAHNEEAGLRVTHLQIGLDGRGAALQAFVC